MWVLDINQWHCVLQIHVRKLEWKLPSFLRSCLLTTTVKSVFYRLHDEREVGSELPLPGGIRDAQHVSIVLSDVHSELQLQRGRRLIHHGNIHHLHHRAG